MNKRDLQTIQKELREAGASTNDAEALAMLAVDLGQLKGSEPRVKVPASAGSIGRRFRLGLPLIGLVVAGSLIAGALVVVVAQGSYPGRFLYPVKRTAENVVVAVLPNYRGVMMMHRAQEVKQLIVLGQSPRLVASTLQDYRVEVAAYHGGNYADFQYCKHSLEQAAALAKGPERVEIVATLDHFSADTE